MKKLELFLRDSLKIFFAIHLFFIKGTFSQVINAPVSTAALLNTKNVMLNCTIQSNQANLVWVGEFAWFQNTFYVLTTNENFTISADKTNLVILNLKSDLAAVYQCFDNVDPNNRKDAYVSAFDPIDCPTDVVYNNSETVLLTCSGFYYLFDIRPNEMLPMIGINNTFDQNYFWNKATGPGNFSVEYNTTLTPDWNGHTIGCQIKYENNQPYYYDSCSYTVYVYHPVTEIEIEGFVTSESSPRPVFVGEVINATANGYPEPEISWYNNNDELVSNDYSLFVTSDMVSYPNSVAYKCLAINTVYGETTNTTLLVYLIVYSSQDEIKTTGVEPWVIVLAVVLPIIIIAAIIITVLLCYRKKKKVPTATLR